MVGADIKAAVMDPTIWVAAIGAAAGIGGSVVAARSSRLVAREHRTTEQERIRLEELNALRSAMADLVDKLTGEVTRLREALTVEEQQTDELRRQIRELERTVHELKLMVFDLQIKLTAYETGGVG